MSEPTSSPTPGWYPNPEGEGLRWWDGAAWTEHLHVEPVATPEPTPEPEPTPAPSPTPTPEPTPHTSSPPPGVASTTASPVASAPPAAGLPAADGGPRRIFGVRPAILIALLVVILAAFLLPKVIFDDDVDDVDPVEPFDPAPDPTPPGDPDVDPDSDEGRKSGGVEQDLPITVLAREIGSGRYLISNTSTPS